jgi:hypothetical protein
MGTNPTAECWLAAQPSEDPGSNPGTDEHADRHTGYREADALKMYKALEVDSARFLEGYSLG